MCVCVCLCEDCVPGLGSVAVSLEEFSHLHDLVIFATLNNTSYDFGPEGLLIIISLLRNVT